MYQLFFILLLSIGNCLLFANDKVARETDMPPMYLYKVISVENWEKSKEKTSVILSTDDKDFIHLATEDQLDRITDKFWKNATAYVILKLQVSRLPGNLILEANPGGIHQYYHLYNGSIPKQAIIESKTILK